VPPSDREINLISSLCRAEESGGYHLDPNPDFLGELDAEHAEAYYALDPAFHWIARDGAGGQIALWLEHEPHPVVWLGGEGQQEVVASSLEELLAIMAHEWSARPFDSLGGDAAYRGWLASVGIAPRDDHEVQLRTAAQKTADFVRWFHAELRRKNDPIILVPMERVGVVPLDGNRAALESTLGKPTTPDWARDPDGTYTAFYPRSPYVIRHGPNGNIVDVTLYLSPFAVTVDDMDLLGCDEAEATAWIRARDPMADVRCRPDGQSTEIWSEKLRLSLTIDRPFAKYSPAWIESVTVRN
jgi:hypothetical protein